MKKAVLDVRSGDTVRVSQKIKEGDKFRIQVFEGTVIRVDKKNSATAREKIEIVRRGKVRRNNLRFLRERSGKSARLISKDFDRKAANTLPEVEEEATEAPAEEKAEA